MTEVTLRLSNATIAAFTAAYGEKHWQRKAAQLLETLAPLLSPPALKAGPQNALEGATARLGVGCLHGTDQLASV